MTRDEYISTFKDYIAHPFGGNGVPSLIQMGPLFEEFLRLEPPPPWRPKRYPRGEQPGGGGKHGKWMPAWNADDTAVLKVACFVHADLEATATALGRTPMIVLKQAFKLRPKIIPTVWAKAYGRYERR